MVLERAGRRLALTAVPLPEGWVLATARDITELDRLERQVERMTQERERYRHELAGLRAPGRRGAPRWSARRWPCSGSWT